MGRLFDLHRYGTAFFLAALFPVAGYAIWRMLSTRSRASCGAGLQPAAGL
jgi:hypothetical protein